MTLTTIILTYNAEKVLDATISSVKTIADQIFVVDSYSTDRTKEIALAHKVRWVEHPFENYGAQRNWAIAEAGDSDWQLHLDSDERLSPELVEEIRQIKTDPPADINGFHIARLVYFMGKPIRHGGMYPIYHTRLFRTGKGRCEDRLYDQHFIAESPCRRLQHPMIDDIQLSLTEWTHRHNRWSDGEVAELTGPIAGERLQPRWTGNTPQRKRFFKGLYYRSPLFLRSFSLWFYRYFLRLGFLDGKEGLIFFTLQTFWFRFLIDAKLHERKQAIESPHSTR